MSDEWYYAVAGQQLGPVTGDNLRNLIASGHVGANDLAWREGLEQWTAVSLLPELLAGVPEGTIPLQPAAVQLAYGGYEPYAGSPLAGVEYGGFWIRVGAYFIDYFVLLIPNQIISTIAKVSFSAPVIRGVPTAAQIFLLFSLALIPLILDWLYYTLMETSSTQATLGKMACGLIVTDVSGKKLTFGRSTGRYFAKMLSSLTLGIGYIMVGTDARKRGLHDIIAKTFVVKKNSLRRTY